jgi:hypothetical protein
LHDPKGIIFPQNFADKMKLRSALQLIALLGVSLLPALAQDASTAAAPDTVTISLSTVANQKLTDDQHGFQGNNLAKLELGTRDFAGVSFLIEAGYVALSGDGGDDGKKKGVEGIKVETTASQLHFLHGTGYGEGGADVNKDAKIAEYIVHYADQTVAKIPVIYGQDVRDWWAWGKPPEVTKGKIAWTGTNAMSEQEDQKIRLYLTSWQNPKPGLKITKIDFKIAEGTPAEPFCIAITAEK